MIEKKTTKFDFHSESYFFNQVDDDEKKWRMKNNNENNLKNDSQHLSCAINVEKRSTLH